MRVHEVGGGRCHGMECQWILSRCVPSHRSSTFLMNSRTVGLNPPPVTRVPLSLTQLATSVARLCPLATRNSYLLRRHSLFVAHSQIWIVPGDIILLSLRDFQDDRADVIHKYTADEARNLKTYGELKSDFSINENAGDEGEGSDDEGGVEFGEAEIDDI